MQQTLSTSNITAHPKVFEEILQDQIHLMTSAPKPHSSRKHPFIKSSRETLNATSHAAGIIICNAHNNILPLLADIVEKLCRYVEHVLTSVPIKHRDRGKVKIEDISLPIDTYSDVKV